MSDCRMIANGSTQYFETFGCVLDDLRNVGLWRFRPFVESNNEPVVNLFEDAICQKLSFVGTDLELN